MQSPSSDARALAQAGVAALAAGDAAKARGLLEEAAAAGQADAPVWIALAAACGALKDEAGERDALDKALALEPRNARALVMKADQFAVDGDARAAASYYAAAVKHAPPNPPPDLARELKRAREMSARYAAQYEAHLRDWLKDKGCEAERSGPRFAQALDILLGKKQIYVQQPNYFYFPELPQVQFYPRADFPWLDAVEAATDDICAELVEVMKDEGAFAPYVEGRANRPIGVNRSGMLNNPEWSAFYLVKYGQVVRENAARCPKTMAALKDAPVPRIKDRAPSILFSLLRARARIPPHNGMINARLICHLPLIVPGECLFRVGNDIRPWVRGKAWVFDDTIEHEAWNRCDETRVVLLFDIWRPELSEEERRAVATMIEAVDAFGGGGPSWNA